MFEKLLTLLPSLVLEKLENESDQYVLIKKYELIYKDHTELLSSLEQLLVHYKATPKKTHDVYCER